MSAKDNRETTLKWASTWMMMMTAEAETLNRAALLFENTVYSDSFAGYIWPCCLPAVDCYRPTLLQLFLVVHVLHDSQNCKIQPVKVSETTAFSKRIATLYSVSQPQSSSSSSSLSRACQRRSLHYK